jgi:5-(carboxyamino)imidazole ribonucleotide mutase
MPRTPAPGAPLVAILMGSDSDLPTMEEAATLLQHFKIGFEMHVASAHRSPDRVATFAREAEGRGLRVLIAGAGAAAHLAGVVAAHTILPVVGVPMDGGSLHGLDALLATVQMPGGIPVATVAIGKAGARNAALLAVQILALTDARLRRALLAYRADLTAQVIAKDRQLQTKYPPATR